MRKIITMILFVCIAVSVNYTDPCATTYGCLFATLSPTEGAKKMDSAGFKLVRLAVILSNTTNNSNINQYLNWGYNVQINLNWKATTFTVPFPTASDTTLMKSRAHLFFQYYLPKKSQIPFIAIENEWDNLDYHSGPITDYIQELRILTTMAHGYGFKVADAGVTSTAVQRWTYSVLTGSEKTAWKSNYFVGENLDNYIPVITQVEDYADLIASVPIDYLNVHWYNASQCSNGWPRSTGLYLKRCNKNAIQIISNEWGTKTQSQQVWEQTTNEVSRYQLLNSNGTLNSIHVVPYACAYSGVNDASHAINLNMQKLKTMKDVVCPPPPDTIPPPPPPPPEDTIPLPVDTIVPPPPPPPPEDTINPDFDSHRTIQKVKKEGP